MYDPAGMLVALALMSADEEQAPEVWAQSASSRGIRVRPRAQHGFITEDTSKNTEAPLIGFKGTLL